MYTYSHTYMYVYLRTHIHIMCTLIHMCLHRYKCVYGADVPAADVVVDIVGYCCC